MKTLSLLLFLFFQLSTFSQISQFDWVAAIEYPGNMYKRSVTTDSSQNVIITGNFTGWCDFDPGPAEHLVQTTGGRDIFVLKLDPMGNFLWVRTFGTIDDDRGFSVVTDSLDNIYINCRVDWTTDFDPGPNTYNLTPVQSEYYGVILSLDPNGNFNWANLVPGHISFTSEFGPIAYHKDGSILITQQFYNTIDFDPGSGVYNLTPTGGSDSYLLSLDLNGNFQWVKQFDQAFHQETGVNSDNSGNIYLAGQYGGTIDFNPGAGVFNMTSLGIRDGFAAKFDSNGDFIWAKSFSGMDDNEVYSISVDSQENVYLSGIFEGTMDADPGASIQNLVSQGNFDAFFLKLNSNGEYLWSHSYGGDLYDWIPHVYVGPNNDLYITGSYYDTIDIDPGVETFNIIQSPSTQINENVDIFICKISSSGDVIWAKVFGGEEVDVSHGVTVDNNQNVYGIGIYRDSIDFNPGYGTDIHYSATGVDGFTIKYAQCYQTTPIPDIASLPNIINDCSVDSLTAPTASEFCAGTLLGVHDATLPITTIGATTITWTYDVGNGFFATQTQDVIITDTEAPIPDIPALSDVSFECSTSSLTPPTATDNCTSNIIVTNNATLPINASTTITWTYDDGNGNTSTQDQNINITPIDNSIIQVDGITLSAVPNGYSYQWVDCNNGNVPISGETGQTFVATVNGNYAVEISDGTCVEISDCIVISQVGIEENDFGLDLVVYPNPNLGDLSIDLGNNYSNIRVAIYNSQGKRVLKKQVENSSSIDLIFEGAPGVYNVSIETSEGKSARVQLVKQ